jgi:hypothetical protein
MLGSVLHVERLSFRSGKSDCSSLALESRLLTARIELILSSILDKRLQITFTPSRADLVKLAALFLLRPQPKPFRSDFGPNYTFASLRNSSCTSCQVTQASRKNVILPSLVTDLCFRTFPTIGTRSCTSAILLRRHMRQFQMAACWFIICKQTYRALPDLWLCYKLLQCRNRGNDDPSNGGKGLKV